MEDGKLSRSGNSGGKGKKNNAEVGENAKGKGFV